RAEAEAVVTADAGRPGAEPAEGAAADAWWLLGEQDGEAPLKPDVQPSRAEDAFFLDLAMQLGTPSGSQAPSLADEAADSPLTVGDTLPLMLAMCSFHCVAVRERKSGRERDVAPFFKGKEISR